MVFGVPLGTGQLSGLASVQLLPPLHTPDPQDETWAKFLEEREWMADFSYKREGEDCPRGTRGASVLDFETPSVSVHWLGPLSRFVHCGFDSMTIARPGRGMSTTIASEQIWIRLLIVELAGTQRFHARFHVQVPAMLQIHPGVVLTFC